MGGAPLKKLHHLCTNESLECYVSQSYIYLSVVECRLEEEKTVWDEGAVPVMVLAGVAEVVSDSVNPVVHELVTSIGDASVVCPFRVEPVVDVTLGGCVNAPGRGLNKSDANCGLLMLLGGVTAGGHDNTCA